MERTETKIRYQKLGGGSFRLTNGKIVKPNEVFTAYPSQIPVAFKDMIVALDKIEVKTSRVADKAKYSVQPAESAGWFNVVDEDGKVVNEKGLRRPAAEDLLETLLNP